MSGFVTATREKTKLKMCLAGPSGAGKSYTALRFAHAMKRAGLGSRIAVIESEAGKIKKYAGNVVDGDRWAFDVCVLENFGPSEYVAKLELAYRSGYDIVIVDSISHEWQGAGGALELVDKVSDKNKFAGWKTVTPLHNAFIDAVLRLPVHVFATCRSKMGYVMEDVEKGGRIVSVPKKVGLEPIQRGGIEYEFEIFCELDTSHVLRVAKTICPLIDGKTVIEPGADFLAPVFAWLNDGVEVVADGYRSALVPLDRLERMLGAMHAAKIDMDRERDWILSKFGASEWTHLTPAQFEQYGARAAIMVGQVNGASAKMAERVVTPPVPASEPRPVPPPVNGNGSGHTLQEVLTNPELSPPQATAQPHMDAARDAGTQGHDAPKTTATQPAPVATPPAPVAEYVRPTSLPLDPLAAVQTMWEEFAHLNGWGQDQKVEFWNAGVLARYNVSRGPDLSRTALREVEQMLVGKIRSIYAARGMSNASPF